ncbi:CASP-like protein 1B2 [Macadamia integrifolia]|uniref:CASP-like protein 1B2 n=1 Tax=Macadamia integrifolia TaxID=60698 RepID=UPI001C4F1C99|nr:CASP-like protein 1B2 [Macadamia integrifolia]
MAHEGGEKLVHLSNGPETKRQGWVLLLLRLLALFAAVSATIVMAFNKETKTIVVATVGTTQITAALQAKFQHTPAFVFFVIVNGIASFHHFIILTTDLFAYKFDFNGFRPLIITILDMGTVALVSSGLGAATAMAELGENGNSHARWSKICDKFGTFCDHGRGALIASFIGLGLLMFLNLLSMVTLFKKPTNLSVVP